MSRRQRHQGGVGSGTPCPDHDGARDPRGVSGPASANPAGAEGSRPTAPAMSANEDAGTIHAVAGYRRPGRDGRRQQRAARRMRAEHRLRLSEQRRQELKMLRAEQRDAHWLPAGGEPGPLAGRARSRLRVQPHRATSDIVSGAYPFLAEAGLGSDGVLVGQDSWSGAAFVFDPWVLYGAEVLTNPNVLVAGQIGRGKSTLAKSLATRSVAFGRRVYVPADPKGEWTLVARALGGQAIELGAGTPNRLNPLDEGPRPSGVPAAAWAQETRRRRLTLLAAITEAALDRRLQAVEHTALAAALTSAEASASMPVLPQVVDALLAPDGDHAGSTREQLAADGRHAGHALARLVRGDLAGLFDGPSTVAFDPNLPMVTLDLSRISGSDTLIGLVMTCASAWMETALADPAGGQRWVIYDEAWRLLAQAPLLSRMQAHWKLSRAWGLANMMIVHRLSDLDAVGDAGSEARGLAQGLLGDTGTRIIYNQPADEAAKAAATLGLTATEASQLPELAKGEGLWKVGERSFVVRHLCTAGELEAFDTNARMRTN